MLPRFLCCPAVVLLLYTLPSPLCSLLPWRSAVVALVLVVSMGVIVPSLCGVAAFVSVSPLIPCTTVSVLDPVRSGVESPVEH